MQQLCRSFCHVWMCASSKIYSGRIIDLLSVISRVDHVGEENLDKFCTNNPWLEAFRSWRVEHITILGLDHLALRLQFRSRGGNELSAFNWSMRFFFKEQWVKYDGCREMILYITSTVREHAGAD